MAKLTIKSLGVILMASTICTKAPVFLMRHSHLPTDGSNKPAKYLAKADVGAPTILTIGRKDTPTKDHPCILGGCEVCGISDFCTGSDQTEFLSVSQPSV